ncbi:hypothetical protein Poli38472_004388 [Pythium oligandrum]|uniref:Uncharacterized protein n=1 Tax=Pythium oligandrum TaxID=41045 RepID=A0A8K1C9Q9_PYTOL|nr:hypothetical protein Poli38472_004388 [Pythium oligandrum]|eukprot:TMW59319.1 hypothetical protein Poli38472_004388 [Pythium oligandrum]
MNESDPVGVVDAVLRCLSDNGIEVTQMPQTIVVPTNVEVDEFKKAVKAAIPKLKLKMPVWMSMFKTAMDPLKEQANKTQVSKTMDVATLEQRKREFTQPYIGQDVPVKLCKYISQCWQQYCSKLMGQAYPYIAIVQSSGFGKSRLVRELAVLTNGEADASMRVLYVCLRRGFSSGYPFRTSHWRNYLFPPADGDDETLQNTLSEGLCTVFQNAVSDWANVGKECFQHFENAQAGVTTLAKLRCDAGSVKHTQQPCLKSESKRILVLVLDEARWLLQTNEDDETGWFRRFRRALNLANAEIRGRYGNDAGIFAILIDTNSKISDFTPPPPWIPRVVRYRAAARFSRRSF